MARVQRIDDERSARALADLLNGDSRERPVAVVTAPAGRAEPWIDAEEIARESGELADVYVMPTGAFTWEFSNAMAEGTQVYGGAGRVYPVGHEWASDLSRSPLRFAFNAADGQRATQGLISDALRMAVSAGLLQSGPQPGRTSVHGVVKGVVAGRALVDIGNFLPAAIPEELTIEDVPITRLLSVGQTIEGQFDPATNRVDITASLRSPADALNPYAVGDIVLTRVVHVTDDSADLTLYPRTTASEPLVVQVPREAVTPNPLDTLDTLMTVGEVIAARVVSRQPWRLSLDDIDDDEQITTAPALLPGGPPWIVEETADREGQQPPPTLPMPSSAPAHAPEATLPDVSTLVVDVVASPALMPRSRPAGPGSPVSAEAAPPAGTRELLLTIDGLKAEVSRLQRDIEALRRESLAATNDAEQLRYQRDDEHRRANRAEHELKAAKARLRKKVSRPSRSTDDAPGPVFADREEGFRYLVTTRWATRTHPAEQMARPLPSYDIGPAFLASLDELEGISDGKVADVVFEIVTGRAPELSGREVHRLRAGSGGDDPVRIREDHAVAWRASLQVNTASARRIHYWLLPDGRFELARVTTHDDFAI